MVLTSLRIVLRELWLNNKYVWGSCARNGVGYFGAYPKEPATNPRPKSHCKVDMTPHFIKSKVPVVIRCVTFYAQLSK